MILIIGKEIYMIIKRIFFLIVLMFVFIISCDKAATENDDTTFELPYSKGDQILDEHQNIAFNIEYGSESETLSLADYAGKIIYLNLSASW